MPKQPREGHRLMQPDPEAVCEACLRLGAFRFDGHTLCEACYIASCDTCCSNDDSDQST